MGKEPLIEIDGAMGEGGGQVLRSSLALSMITQTPFRITRIRANRKKAGLLRQHLTAVRAATEISGASVDGAQLRSDALEFHPGPVVPGDYRFAVGSAGSANLVLQTVLPALMTATDPSEILLEGGTHNPTSPPFDFLAESFAPLLHRMGVGLELELLRYGFYPAGGGRFRATIVPEPPLRPLHLTTRGPVHRMEVTAIIANLRTQIAQRELKAVADELRMSRQHLHPKTVDSDGPGNVVLARCTHDHGTAVFSAFGRRGLAADRVGQALAAEVQAWLDHDVPVDEHLADQLLLPIALAGEGSFVTTTPSSHTLTNIDVIDRFLGRRFQVTEQAPGRVAIAL